MKNTFVLLISIFFCLPSFAQIKPEGFILGVSLGRPWMTSHTAESPSNFSQIFLGHRFTWHKTPFTLTPRLSVQRNLITTNHYFEQVGSEYRFTEAPNIYQNNRLMTFVATFGLGLSVQRTIEKDIKLELLIEPQIGKNIVNTQLYVKDGESQKRQIDNNPLVSGGEISLWLKKKCSCGGTFMIGPGVVLQNGSYVRDEAFRTVIPMVSIAAIL